MVTSFWILCTMFLMLSQQAANAFEVVASPGIVRVPVGGTFKAVWTLRDVTKDISVTIQSPTKGRLVSFIYGHQHPVESEVDQTHFTHYGDARSTFGVIVYNVQLNDMGVYRISQLPSDIPTTEGSTCELVVYERSTMQSIISTSLIGDATDQPIKSDPSHNYRTDLAMPVTVTVDFRLKGVKSVDVPVDTVLSLTAIGLTVVFLVTVIVICMKRRPNVTINAVHYDENRLQVDVRTRISVSESDSEFEYDDIRNTTRPRVRTEEDDHSYEKPDPPPDTEYEKPYQFIVHTDNDSDSIL